MDISRSLVPLSENQLFTTASSVYMILNRHMNEIENVCGLLQVVCEIFPLISFLLDESNCAVNVIMWPPQTFRTQFDIYILKCILYYIIAQ